MAKLQRSIDVFSLGQWVFQPGASWVYVALPSLIQAFTFKSAYYGHGLPLHSQSLGRLASTYISHQKNKFHKIIKS